MIWKINILKGKLGNFFLLAQSFYWPQTKRSLNRQFSPKSPKVGKKSGQSVKKWPNKTPLASDLLWESTKSVIGAAVGIHQIWHRSCCGNPLFGNFSIRPTVGIHQICHRSCCGNPPIPSSELLWESMRVYNSIRWMYFNNNNYNCSSVGCLPTRYFEPRYRYFEARYRYFEARYQYFEARYRYFEAINQYFWARYWYF